MKELQSDTSSVFLPAHKGRSTVILNLEDYLEKCMDHINNGPYQLLKKDPTTKIKTKTLKQLKVLKDNQFIGNKLYYYLKPTESPAPRFYGQLKINKSRVQTGNMKIAMPRILPRFPTTSEMFPLKMMR